MKGLKQITLVAAIATASSMAQAGMVSLDDAEMSAAMGQAGLTVDINKLQIDVGAIYYKDQGFLSFQDVHFGAGGAVVNNSSVWGVLGTSMGVPAYVASKHGVIGLTKAAALEFGPKGIRANSICPAWVPTPGNEPVLSDPGMNAAITSQHPIGRLGSQEDIAGAVMWLCSEESSWYTAQALVVDGGYSAQ